MFVCVVCAAFGSVGCVLTLIGSVFSVWFCGLLYVCFCVVLFGSVWLCLVLFGSVWIDPFGSVSVLFDSVWFCLDPFGSVAVLFGSVFVMFGSVWF